MAVKDFWQILLHLGQFVGIISVGLCLFSGLRNGDYRRPELIEFVVGSGLFYFCSFFLKKKKSS